MGQASAREESRETGKFFTLFIDDKEYQVHQETITAGEIMDLGGIPRSVGLVAILDDGSQEPLRETDEVELKPGRRFKKAPRFRRG